MWAKTRAKDPLFVSAITSFVHIIVSKQTALLLSTMKSFQPRRTRASSAENNLSCVGWEAAANQSAAADMTCARCPAPSSGADVAIWRLLGWRSESRSRNTLNSGKRVVRQAVVAQIRTLNYQRSPEKVIVLNLIYLKSLIANYKTQHVVLSYKGAVLYRQTGRFMFFLFFILTLFYAWDTFNFNFNILYI